LLNWTGGKIESLKVKAKLQFDVSSVISVKNGNVKYTVTDGTVIFEIPLDAADFVMLRK